MPRGRPHYAKKASFNIHSSKPSAMLRALTRPRPRAWRIFLHGAGDGDGLDPWLGLWQSLLSNFPAGMVAVYCGAARTILVVRVQIMALRS